MVVYKEEGKGILGREADTSKGPQAERHRLLRAARWYRGEGEQRERPEATCESWGFPWDPGARGAAFRMLRVLTPTSGLLKPNICHRSEPEPPGFITMCMGFLIQQ